MSDSIYTPPYLAREMAAAIRRSRVRIVADIAVGGGELLRAAEQKWPNCELYGLDIDSSAINILRRKKKSWTLRTGDLIKKSPKELKWPRADVLLINPPFSCRGGTRISINVAGSEHAVSRALACLIRGMSFLKQDGEIAALLPAGCLHSEKDSQAWATLRRQWDVTLIRECKRNTFDSFYPSTVLLHLCRHRVEPEYELETCQAPVSRTVQLVRGKVQMHSLCESDSGRAPVLHTTDLLREHRLKPEAVYKEGNGTVEGLCIVLPRVGKPDPNKLVIHHFAKATRLSDCLFGMQCSSEAETRALFRAMQSQWSVLCKLYVGTGASFITLQRLTNFLAGLECKADTVQNIRGRGDRPSRYAKEK